MKGRLLILVATLCLVLFGLVHVPPSPQGRPPTGAVGQSPCEPPIAVQVPPVITQEPEPAWILYEHTLPEPDPGLLGEPLFDVLPPDAEATCLPTVPLHGAGAEAPGVPEPISLAFAVTGACSVLLYHRRVRRRRLRN